MYVAGTLASAINSRSLFGAQKDLRKNTLLPIPDEDVERLLGSINSRGSTPVDVLLNQRLSSVSRLEKTTNEGITVALSRNSAINSYLEKAKEKLERMEGLAEDAAVW